MLHTHANTGDAWHPAASGSVQEDQNASCDKSTPILCTSTCSSCHAAHSTVGCSMPISTPARTFRVLVSALLLSWCLLVDKEDISDYLLLQLEMCCVLYIKIVVDWPLIPHSALCTRSLVGELVTHSMALDAPERAASRAAGCLVELHQVDRGLGPLGRAQQQPVAGGISESATLANGDHGQMGASHDGREGVNGVQSDQVGVAADRQGAGMGEGVYERGNRKRRRRDKGQGHTRTLFMPAQSSVQLPPHALPPLTTRPPHRAVLPLFSQHQQPEQHSQQPQQVLLPPDWIPQQQQQPHEQQQQGSRYQQLSQLHSTWLKACGSQAQPSTQHIQPSVASPPPLLHSWQAPAALSSRTDPATSRPPTLAPLLCVDMGAKGNVGRWIGHPLPGQAPNLVTQVCERKTTKVLCFQAGQEGVTVCLAFVFQRCTPVKTFKRSKFTLTGRVCTSLPERGAALRGLVYRHRHPCHAAAHVGVLSPDLYLESEGWLAIVCALLFTLQQSHQMRLKAVTHITSAGTTTTWSITLRAVRYRRRAHSNHPRYIRCA